MSFVEEGTWGRVGGTMTDSSTSIDTGMQRRRKVTVGNWPCN